MIAIFRQNYKKKNVFHSNYEPHENSAQSVQNSVRLIITVKNKFFFNFVGKWLPFLGVELLGALLAPRWPQMRSGPPVELHLDASWSLCWRQDGPSGAKMSQVGIKLAVKFGKLRTKRRILYIQTPDPPQSGHYVIVVRFSTSAILAPFTRRPKSTQSAQDHPRPSFVHFLHPSSLTWFIFAILMPKSCQ